MSVAMSVKIFTFHGQGVSSQAGREKHEGR